MSLDQLLAAARIPVDPISTAVMQKRLDAIADEMAITLLRSTRSPFLNQAGDLGTGVYDATGRILAQAEYIPIISLSLSKALSSIRDFFKEDVRPGDVILHNDVFSGGLQNSDAGAFMPIFYRNELVAWVGCKGHQIDMGGPVPGSCNPYARTVWEEALRIPPVKVYGEGVFLKDVWNLIFSNVRRREIVEADMQAQIGACRVGARQVLALVDQLGPRAFQDRTENLLSATEQMMRKAIARIPSGEYEGESFVNVDIAEWGRRRYRIAVSISVSESEIRLDYSGTEPQSETYINAPLASSASAALMAIFMIVDPAMPHNDGALRPIHIDIPSGTLLNCDFPAATFYGNFLSVPNYEAIIDAMADVLPAGVTAAWNRPFILRTSGVDPESGLEYFDIHFPGYKGGGGAMRGLDGYNQASPIFAPALKVQDYELFEVQHPNFLLKHEYRIDSAGPGEWRGGLGVEWECRLDGESISAITQGDGLVEGAAGMHFGCPGALNELEIAAPSGGVYRPHAMEIVGPLAPGTVIRQRSGGGGGYGDPLQRTPEVVSNDVEQGYVSIEAAERDYGVALRNAGEGQLAVDEERTHALRSQLTRQRTAPASTRTSQGGNA